MLVELLLVVEKRAVQVGRDQPDVRTMIERRQRHRVHPSAVHSG